MSTVLEDWAFEGVLQFLRSPLWATPIQNFLEEYCSHFTEDEENKLIYTEIHTNFRALVDELLTTYLSELGIPSANFVESIKRREHEELSAVIAEFVLALDDFSSFRALMERKNVEMELEAMYEYARLRQVIGADDDDDISDEERFLIHMAMRLSLGESDIAMKQLEQEDAEAMHALALELAYQHEAAARGEAIVPDVALQQEALQRRQETVSRGVEDIASGSPTRGQAKPELAPVGQRSGAFGAKKMALPDIAKTAPPTEQVQQPTFDELRRTAAVKVGLSSEEPSAEEVKQRTEYFNLQRERIRQQKQQQREVELQQYKATLQGGAPPPAEEAPQDDAKDLRVQLARRFKEDLIHESRRASAT